jgi:Zinc finger, C3HC4 type (RING finger)
MSANNNNRSRCPGCYPILQDNQLGHMGPGGCLSGGDDDFCILVNNDDNDEEVELNEVVQNLEGAFESVAQEQEEQDSRNLQLVSFLYPDQGQDQQDQDQVQDQVDVHKSIANPLFETPEPMGECPICYEDLTMINFTVTTCGHKFHSSCIFQALEKKEHCPCCRHQLIPLFKDDDEEEYEEDDDDDDESNDNEDDDADSANEEPEPEPKITLVELSEKLTKIGYSQVDILAYFMIPTYVDNWSSSSSNQEKYTDEFMDKMTADLNTLLDGTYVEDQQVQEQTNTTTVNNLAEEKTQKQSSSSTREEILES